MSVPMAPEKTVTWGERSPCVCWRAGSPSTTRILPCASLLLSNHHSSALPMLLSVSMLHWSSERRASTRSVKSSMVFCESAARPADCCRVSASLSLMPCTRSARATKASNHLSSECVYATPVRVVICEREANERTRARTHAQ